MSNLLDKASILLTPTAYSDGTLHSVKPVQTFGSELVTNGDFATDSNWSVNAGWSISDGKANIDTDNGTLNLTQSGVLVVGKKYKLSLIANVTVGSIKFESGEGDNLVFTSNIDSHIFTADSTQVIFRRQVVPTRGYIDNVSIVEVTDGDFDFTRATTATRVNSSGLIESVASGLPRIDFTGGTGQILLEPASTNVSENSENTSSWSYVEFGSGSAGTITTGKTDMFGGTNAVQVDFPADAENVAIRFGQTSSSITSGTSTISIYAKLVQSGSKTLRFRASSSQNLVVNSTEFVRYEATVTKSSGEAFNLKLRPSQGTSSGGFSIIICHPQEEAQSFATSYIPTSGSTVTRNKDEANNSGDTSLINSTEGVLYVEIAALANDTTSRSISLTSGNNTDRVTLQYRNASNAINAFYRSSNVNIGQIFFSASDITQFSKIAYRYKENDFALFVDGVKVGSVTSGSFSSTLTALSFDRTNSNDTQFFGKVKCVAVFKEALTDAELIALTS